MRAKLLITNLNSREGEFEKVVPPELEIMTIGRHPSSYVYLTSAHISKEHALIIRESDIFYLVDKSSNGTLLNQVRIEKEKRYALKSGDVITVGEFRIVFATEQELPKAQPQPQPKAAQAAAVSVPEVQTPAFDPYNSNSFDVEPDADPMATIAPFAPTSLEDVIRGLDAGEEASYLVFVGGARDGQRVELRGNTSEIFVGRAPNCQVQISHASIAQIHAKIRMDWAGITVYDLNSQTGVFINGVRINSSRKLHNGDEISFGVPVSSGGVKLILYDRNSISGDSWVGLPPPVKVENNEKLEEKPKVEEAVGEADVAPPAAAAPVASAAPATAAETGNAEIVDVPPEERPSAGLLDLNRAVYGDITLREVLVIIFLVVVAGLFSIIALSFI